MNLVTASSQIAYCLTEGVEIRDEGQGIAVVSPFFQVAISPLEPGLRQVFSRLAQSPCSMRWINETIDAAHLMTCYRYLSSLMRHQMCHISVISESSGEPLATLYPTSASFQHKWINVQPEQLYRLSRFAYLRRGEDEGYWLESPLAHALLTVQNQLVVDLLYQLGTTRTPLELARMHGEGSLDTVADVLTLLLMGNFAAATTDDGQLGETQDAALRQWEFHDLLFHSRSRGGRHSNSLGGTYRFLYELPAQPVIKPAPWPVTVQLPLPDMERVQRTDPTLAQAMEERASIRTYNEEHPITMEQISEFLYRVAHIKDIYTYGESGELSRRPYPGGGASYELECYLTVDRCSGLAPGLYWYNPLRHTLSLVREPDKDTERLAIDAGQSMGEEGPPQVLITLTARFQRVSWKYQSIAYALILKDVGVLYATMYLVASAMNLAPCAIGAGDSDLFASLIGADYYQETSVGEFALGSR
ncbi:SagB/ThcOx family dehydrogenase [Dictyobacter aurantiacus]|uniref:Dehydrogenase n=1 Tax=Dictyobacter aurantiacus TaxID=1936993 RepID=A0A401ZMI3_9CHLR|nr:SagB family peptide dehydrogenase [Dictyobacter aurantiacus]GCE08034.1 dehydrogenase [Dictyobacter aurantiacus]